MLLAISGKAGAGKDTLAALLCRQYKFVTVSLADPLKRFCRDVFSFSNEQLWGPSFARNAADPRYPRPGDADQPYLTPRYALQRLGTEWGRDCYQAIWAEYAVHTAKKLLQETPLSHYAPHTGIYAPRSPVTVEGVVIPDARFQNELEAVRAAGGKVARIKRSQAGLRGTAAAHASETEQDSLEDGWFDFVLENDGTMDDLERNAVKMVQSLWRRE
jgi:hypothetical protein